MSPPARDEAELFLIRETAVERMRRVEEIRRQVETGSYEVAPGDVADAVVAFFRRGPEPAPAANPDVADDTC